MTKKSKMATRKSATTKKAAATKKLVAINYWLVGLVFLIATAGTFSYLWLEKNYQPTDDLMPIRVVELEGNLNHVTRDQIVAILTKDSLPGSCRAGTSSAPTGAPHCRAGAGQLPGSDDGGNSVIGFFGSDLQLLEQRLETLAWLQKAELRRVWPDRLHIKIKEHKAIARWNDDALINEFGEIFKPNSIDGLDKLPLITGPEQDLQQLLVTFRELQQLFAPVGLQLNVLNLNHRYSWSLELVNGIQLEIGRKHLIQRVERFIALYPLLQRESDLPIAKVDLRYDTGLAVTRLETSELQASL